MYPSALYRFVPIISQNNLSRAAAGSGKDVRTKKLSPTTPPEKSFERPLQAADLRSHRPILIKMWATRWYAIFHDRGPHLCSGSAKSQAFGPWSVLSGEGACDLHVLLKSYKIMLYKKYHVMVSVPFCSSCNGSLHINNHVQSFDVIRTPPLIIQHCVDWHPLHSSHHSLFLGHFHPSCITPVTIHPPSFFLTRLPYSPMDLLGEKEIRIGARDPLRRVLKARRAPGLVMTGDDIL